MDCEYGENKPRRIMDEDSLTGIDFFSGDEVVDVDDIIDLDVPIRPRFGYELIRGQMSKVMSLERLKTAYIYVNLRR